jgi:uncharacterized protein involved in exopolysaccharide biosynthesis
VRDLTPDGIPSEGEFSLVEIASALLRWRRTIIAFAVVGGIVGVALGLSSKRKFASRAIFAPQVASDQVASGLALAASQFGIRVAGSGSGWPAAVYVELLISRGLLEPIARDTVTVVEEGNRRVAVMDLLKIKAPTPAQRVEETVRRLRTMVVPAENKRLGAVQLTVTTTWPSVSYALANRLISAVNTFNTQTRQSQASAERQFVQGRAREAEIALRDAEDRMQAFLQRNRVVSSPDLTFERDRLQREITLRQQAYTALLQSQEEARIREVRDTPVITILEQPALPAIGEPRHSVSKGVMGAIVGILLAIFFKAIAVARTSSNERNQEFYRVLDDALPRFLRRRARAG